MTPKVRGFPLFYLANAVPFMFSEVEGLPR